MFFFNNISENNLEYSDDTTNDVRGEKTVE